MQWEFPEDFPEREEDILALARQLIAWLEQNPDLAGGAPFSAEELRAAMARATEASAKAAEADANLRSSHDSKDQSLLELKEALASRLQFVELDVRGQHERFSGLGWGGRPGATDRQPPGPVRDVRIRTQADTSLVLEWRPPRDGGPTARYRIERRIAGGAWEPVATAVDNDRMVGGLPQSVELDLRVVPVNEAGDGPASAVVTVVL